MPSTQNRRVPVTQLGLEDPDAHVVQVRAAVFLAPPRLQPALGAQGEVEPLVIVDGLRAPARVDLLGQVLVQEGPDLIRNAC